MRGGHVVDNVVERVINGRHVREVPVLDLVVGIRASYRRAEPLIAEDDTRGPPARVQDSETADDPCPGHATPHEFALHESVLHTRRDDMRPCPFRRWGWEILTPRTPEGKTLGKMMDSVP